MVVRCVQVYRRPEQGAHKVTGRSLAEDFWCRERLCTDLLYSSHAAYSKSLLASTVRTPFNSHEKSPMTGIT